MLLRWWKQRTAQSLIGLDIGSDTIKLLELNCSEKPYQVKNFVISALPPNTIVKDEIKDYAAIGTILREIFRNNNFKSKLVALAVPRSLVFIKNINIDSGLNDQEIESRAWVEANQHFPDLIGEIYLDFSVSPSTQDSKQLELTLVACRKDQVNPYLAILKEAGLIPKIMDVNSNALERALNLMVEDQANLNTVALLNLDKHLSTFLVIHEKKLIYAHDQSYDGNRLQTQTQEYLKTANDKVTSLDDLAYVEILKSTLSAHLRHTMHFFYSSRPNINIQKIILSGDCAVISGLAAFIHREVNTETLLANPFKDMEIDHSLDAKKLEQLAPTLALSCGLALSVDRPIHNYVIV